MSGQRWDVMSIREYQHQGQTKTSWTRVGAAFTNRDGSINVQLDAFPIDGKLQLQIPLSPEERQARKQNWQNRGREQGQNRYRPQSTPQRLASPQPQQMQMPPEAEADFDDEPPPF